jgi:hypothetical protein
MGGLHPAYATVMPAEQRSQGPERRPRSFATFASACCVDRPIAAATFLAVVTVGHNG